MTLISFCSFLSYILIIRLIFDFCIQIQFLQIETHELNQRETVSWTVYNAETKNSVSGLPLEKLKRETPNTLTLWFWKERDTTIHTEIFIKSFTVQKLKKNGIYPESTWEPLQQNGCETS